MRLTSNTFSLRRNWYIWRQITEKKQSLTFAQKQTFSKNAIIIQHFSYGT